ncbi:MAG: hypothetical protein ACYCOR_10940 [Acidobacteriaceae bacterium]
MIQAQETGTESQQVPSTLSLSVDAKELGRALRAILPAVDRYGFIEAAKGVHLSFDGDQVELEACHEFQGLRIALSPSATRYAPNNSAGAVVFDPRLLLKALPKTGAVSLEVSGESLRVSGGVAPITLATEDLKAWPTFHKGEGEILATLSAQSWQEMAKLQATFAGKEKTGALPILSETVCLLPATDTEGATATSTDIFRMTVLHLYGVVSAPVIIRNMAGTAKAIAEFGWERVSISKDKETGKLYLTSGAVEGGLQEKTDLFPSTVKLIEEGRTGAPVKLGAGEVAALLAATKALAPFVGMTKDDRYNEKGSRGLWFDVNADAQTCTVSLRHGDQEEQAEGTIRNAINPRFLADSLEMHPNGATLYIRNTLKPIQMESPEAITLTLPIRYL